MIRNQMARQIIHIISHRLRARRNAIPRIGNNSSIRNRLQHSYNHLEAYRLSRNELNHLARSALARPYNIEHHPEIIESRRAINNSIQRQARRSQMLLRAYHAIPIIVRGLRNTGRRRI